MSITDIIINHVCELHIHYREMFNDEKNDNNSVQLGRSFRISDKFQFDFAKALSKVIESDKILVDFPISCSERAQPLYPDILIIKSGLVTAIIEMKIDLGFLNLSTFGIKSEGKSNYSYDINDNIFKRTYDDLIKSEKVYYKKKGGEKERVRIGMSKMVKKLFVIITEQNDHGRMKYFKEAIEDAGFDILFLLKETVHPNRNYDLTENIKQELTKKSAILENYFADL